MTTATVMWNAERGVFVADVPRERVPWQETVECPVCDGSGTIECDQHGSESECPKCEGEGYVAGSDQYEVDNADVMAFHLVDGDQVEIEPDPVEPRCRVLARRDAFAGC